MMALRNVVIGGGCAGLWAAIGVREKDPEAMITLVSDESFLPYERPPLSKDVLTGTESDAPPEIVPKDYLENRQIDLCTGKMVDRIDCSNKQVTFVDGGKIGYDKLVLATGSSLRELPVLPKGLPHVHYLRRFGDAQRLKADLDKANRLVVVGAGWIGLEIAASAIKLGKQVYIVEAADRILARSCPVTLSNAIYDMHVEKGVNFYLGKTIEQVQKADGYLSLRLNSHETLAADVVVVGVGISANTTLAQTASLKIDDGIVVDEFGRTSNPDIFAAGEVTRVKAARDDALYPRIETWENAQEQGLCVGHNVVSETEPYCPVPYFWSDQYEVRIQGVGFMPSPDVRPVLRQYDDGFSILYLNESHQVTSIFALNAPKDIVSGKKLIERNLTVERDEIANTAMPLMKILKKK